MLYRSKTDLLLCPLIFIKRLPEYPPVPCCALLIALGRETAVLSILTYHLQHSRIFRARTSRTESTRPRENLSQGFVQAVRGRYAPLPIKLSRRRRFCPAILEGHQASGLHVDGRLWQDRL